MQGAALEAEGVSVVFGGTQKDAAPAVDVPKLSIPPGSFVAFTGPSGSGKTSLLHVIAGVLVPTTGSVRWDATNIAKLGEAKRDRWRRHQVGLIFQDFHLIDQLSPLGNVLLPATFSRFAIPGALKKRASDLLDQLGVPTKRRSVTELSRGERQRVAIARALLFDPPILLADEPTASLDAKSGELVAGELAKAAASGRTTIVVSHDRMVAERCDRVIRLEHGKIVSDGAPSAAAIAPAEISA